MRKLAPILVVMTLTATRLEAQYDRRYEVGIFGAFTKYDKAFNLADKPGGGVRLRKKSSRPAPVTGTPAASRVASSGSRAGAAAPGGLGGGC